MIVELITLDSSYQPNSLFEDYDSLIWSERYSRNGDFELVSSNVQSVMNTIPLETVVSLRESTVPMVVETIKIAQEKSGGVKVTATGRSFETVLERRSSVSSLPASGTRTPWVMASARASDAAYKAIRMVIGDVERGVSDSFMPAETPRVSPLDAIPGIDLPIPVDYTPNPSDIEHWVSNRTYSSGDLVIFDGKLFRAIADISSGEASPETNNKWVLDNSNPTWQNFEIKPGDLYSTVVEMLKTNHHGLKAVRPNPGGSKISIEIYNGADQSESYVLEARHDQLENSTQLLSYQGSANVAYVYGANGAQVVLKNTGSEPSGLNRRVMILDEATEGVLTTSDLRRSRGLVELYKRNATALYDGDASYQVAMAYNRDYFLGDIVSLVGEYGAASKVRVEEFIRTKDASGTKAYPTFEVVDEL